MTLANEFAKQLLEAASRLGRELEGNLDEVRAYAASRMLHLSKIIDEPGYQEALLAERDSVAMKAGIQVVDSADASDREILGIISGAIAIGARALVP